MSYHENCHDAFFFLEKVFSLYLKEVGGAVVKLFNIREDKIISAGPARFIISFKVSFDLN